MDRKLSLFLKQLNSLIFSIKNCKFWGISSKCVFLLLGKQHCHLKCMYVSCIEFWAPENIFSLYTFSEIHNSRFTLTKIFLSNTSIILPQIFTPGCTHYSDLFLQIQFWQNLDIVLIFFKIIIKNSPYFFLMSLSPFCFLYINVFSLSYYSKACDEQSTHYWNKIVTWKYNLQLRASYNALGSVSSKL